MSWRRFLYSALWYLLLPLVLLRLWLRGRSNIAYRQRWLERFGWVQPPSNNKQKVICLHAVSVGEAIAARPLVECLLEDAPDYRLWITTTTPTGSDTVKRLFGDAVSHSYLSYDMPDAVERFLSRVNPSLFLVMETELWPNLYAACDKRAIPLLLLNARLSGRSVRRYQKIRALTAETLGYVTGVMARGEQDAASFRQLGAPVNRVEALGNIKFDLNIDAAILDEGQAMRQQFGDRPVWCAGSTHLGEETLLLEVHKKLLQAFPDLLLILVPRHPERFDGVADLCDQQGVAYVRRTQAMPTSEHSVLLGDSMGELLLWYAASDIAFIGGSLVPVGGHNPLEALALGVPVLSGRHVHNFADLYPELVVTQSTRLVESQAELQDHTLYWLEHAGERLSAGQAGQAFLRQNRGVVKRLLAVIMNTLS